VKLHNVGAACKEAHQTLDVAFAVQTHAATIVLHSEGVGPEPYVNVPRMTLLVLVDRVGHQRSRKQGS